MEQTTYAESPRRLYKSRRERMIDGVCGGIAEYFERFGERREGEKQREYDGSKAHRSLPRCGESCRYSSGALQAAAFSPKSASLHGCRP